MSTKRGASSDLIRRAEMSDLGHIVNHIRPEDVAEVRDGAGLTIPAAITLGFPYDCWVGLSPSSGNPVVIFGVVPSALPEAGCVWMMATTELEKCQMAFLRRNHEFLPKLHDKYPLIFNYVDARNEVHIKWLKWLGFTFIRRIEEYGPAKLPFYEIARIQIPCVDPPP